MSVVERPVEARPEAPESDEVAWVLEQAADALMEYGWTTGVTREPSGAMCVRGAILRVTEGQSPTRHENAEDRLADYLGVDTVVRWNDEVCQSEVQAVRALREAAAS